MTVAEIRDTAIDSANAYYLYLEKNEKGLQEVDIFELEVLDSRDLLIRLRLAAKLFDTEVILFKNFRNNKKYDSGQIKILEYDSEKNILLIKPSIEIVEDFRGLRNTDLKVISDLKFLVQRVQTWFEKNGAHLQIPKQKSVLFDTTHSIKFLSDKELLPSQNQKDSLHNIFNNPFSYVWGAPGTGKTQFVLSYAVLHYLSRHKKVAILAPTNNSIEQVLRGVINMIDKAGIDRKQIIRLGTPSKKFAEEYPEVCEEKGIQKRLEEIDKQISIFERVINYNIGIDRLAKKEDGLQLFNNLKEIYNNILKYNYEFEIQSSILKKKEIDIKYKNQELQQIEIQKQDIDQKKNSLIYKIQKFFTSSPTGTDNQLIGVKSAIISCLKDMDFLKYEYEILDTEFQNKKKLLNTFNQKLSDTTAILKTLFSDNNNHAEWITTISEKTWESVAGKIRTDITIEKNDREVDGHLISEYKSIPLDQLQNKITEYIALRIKLSISSTEERLKSVQVICCTLDGYIGRYPETKLDVEHIFLDEAGYANIIKTLTLFNHKVPITLLGDHMQLPPVCEINDKEIKQNDVYSNMFLWAQSAIHLDHLFETSRDVCLTQYLNNSSFNPTFIKKSSLNATYRFGSNLAKILSLRVYNGEFESLNPIGETKILYVNAFKREALMSRESRNEVLAISKIVENLKKLGLDNYVILTPYKKQIRLLNTALPQDRNDLKILTVHGSQGREWDTVILSVVDTKDKFLVDSTLVTSRGLNLVNTAVSRAKRQLIIVCDTNHWLNERGQLITDLIKNGNEIVS